jgi:hypothetical protein
LRIDLKLIYFGAIFLNKTTHFDRIITVSYIVRGTKKKKTCPMPPYPELGQDRVATSPLHL